ncbi:ATP-binding cassette domain-containing protein [Bacillus sp. FSL W8-0116]|uniref:ATP-binding cassette domain-containing protein n=1 Tax=Bacillus TaxID=1386 RepID=UPI0030FB113F
MIDIINLTKTYRNKTVLDKINVQIPPNKIAFIMGENGAGKTTLLKCLLELEEYSGKILYDGKTIDEVRNDIHVVYDDSPFYLNLNGYKNIELLLTNRIQKEQIREVANAYLSHDILKNKVKKYSYGQRKKLSLIIATLSQPKYLLMDEVSNGLDYDSMQFLKTTLKEWSKNMTIITTGHQFDFYAPIIDELFILKQSKLTKLNNFKESGGDLVEAYKKYIK